MVDQVRRIVMSRQVAWWRLILTVMMCGVPACQPAAEQPEARSEGPIVITRGGVYRGRWRSLDATIPVVAIRTADPVVIEGSLLEGRGHLIKGVAEHAKITVRDCYGRGLDPGVAGRCPGRFFTAEAFDSIVVANNEFEGTSGIYLLEYHGPADAALTVRVVGNHPFQHLRRIS